ncbi:MAG: hypothetical protein ACON47_01465 [Flavobacteriaceae bacterium]
MSSVKQLKKDINDSIGALIEDIYVVELDHPNVDAQKTDPLIDAAIQLFDELISEVNAAKNKGKKAFAPIREKLNKGLAQLESDMKKLS